MIIRKNNVLTLDTRNNCNSTSSRFFVKEQSLPKLDLENSKIFSHAPHKSMRTDRIFNSGSSVPSIRGIDKGYYTERNPQD